MRQRHDVKTAIKVEVEAVDSRCFLLSTLRAAGGVSSSCCQHNSYVRYTRQDPYK
jgi:hypothetical protein